jgi:hypothetical protein
MEGAPPTPTDTGKLQISRRHDGPFHWGITRNRTAALCLGAAAGRLIVAPRARPRRSAD